ncbi:uncharacterized protein F4807DRAFT_257179 [Annulohypoxylon truncatum]|uniref:uncharacterized protein n=1 Tax=Annulohypoxylon truncatum TaxID=327061 RepID=UPI0020089268|nr:uncharacterized protein F4807DRAFT_257179 [Annulohypoxylon truncatum]KAI1213276.1 hypothetical protein F4807DRAFT_257179 [Annulohypoxylon truncatum]
MMDCSDAVITLPALGQDVQLGMLYDVRDAQLFAGLSLWDDKVVNAHQELEDHKVQNAGFIYSTSLDESRSNAALDVEGSLSLDLGIVKATGPAKYLNDNKSSRFEARVDSSCTIVRCTRRISQETLSSMKYERNLDNPRFTHFVAEVVEGGSATLSFVQSCSSSEEATKVSGELKVEILKIPVSSSAKVDYSNESKFIFDNVNISYSGAMTENVSNIEDARRVSREMPAKLALQLNTISYKLLPLSVLDNKVNRMIRKLDDNLVAKTAAALKAGTMVRLELKNVVEQDVFRKWFPAIRQQISNIQTAFTAGETEFTQAARRLLPELRDGTTDHRTKMKELSDAIALFEQRTSIAEQFVANKFKEASTLRTTVASLLADGFEDHLSGLPPQSLTDTGAPRLLLSFGGKRINRPRHPLQSKIESSGINAVGDDDPDDDEDDEDDCEWFDDQQIVSNLGNACVDLRQQRVLALPGVVFGVASIDRAYRPGTSKRTRTNIGDIVLDYKRKLLIVTSMLPKVPTAPTLTTKGQTITAAWSEERSDDERLAIPTTGLVIRSRPRPNPLQDGPFPHATSNEAFTEVHCKASETTVLIDRGINDSPLFDDCDYEVMLCVETIVGLSNWSEPVVCRTPKLPSTASKIIDFYRRKSTELSKGAEDSRPWDFDKSGSRKTLFIGHRTKAVRTCTDSRFKGEVAVRIVDVAAEFEPNIPAADIGDQDKTMVAVFAGSSGHGKSTEINAFISYLLGSDPSDPARLMVIDDRGAKQSQSVTQYVTCYRIRPLSPLFEGKTLLIVDTPGYGDSRGIERDAFVTAAMSDFFRTIEHVNAIIFTCRANEARSTFLSPIATYVFSLFAKDVKSCLRTIYTFADAGAPLARAALRELNWPVENGEVEVNNAAFTLEIDVGNKNKVREWWLMSVRGQFRLMQTLLRRPAILTAASAKVTQDRLELERKCVQVEKKILRTANDAQVLIANLGALANAIGAAPTTKILVEEDRSVQKPVRDGTATTLCLKCNHTCHEECVFSDDKDKKNCTAMTDGNCDECKGHCHWTDHKNAQFIIVTEKHKEYVVPKDLIKRWNTNNNTLEGALLDAIDAYLGLQEELRKDLVFLAKLTEKLMSTALLHDPNALINYIDTLIKTARAQGAPPEQLNQLTTAKNTLLLERAVMNRGAEATLESGTLLHVLGIVYGEMRRRMELESLERAKEEEKPCDLYNRLHEKLPALIQKNAPKPLKEKSRWSLTKGASYGDNLKAVVELVQVVLRDGGVVAALVTSTK